MEPGRFAGACSSPSTGRPGIALPPGSALPPPGEIISRYFSFQMRTSSTKSMVMRRRGLRVQLGSLMGCEMKRIELKQRKRSSRSRSYSPCSQIHVRAVNRSRKWRGCDGTARFQGLNFGGPKVVLGMVPGARANDLSKNVP